MHKPIPAWPGEFVSLGENGDVFVRSAPAVRGGAGDAEPALCVHGFGGSSTNWTDLMQLLSGAVTVDGAVAELALDPVFDCDAIDLPGFGFSPPAEDRSSSVSGQAATVAAFIERRGRGPVHLIGNSLGGAVCTRVAATRPELIRTLTLIAPAMPDLWPRPASARFPALCVPGFGGWLLRRAQTLSAKTRVELSLATVYFDRSCVHPDRLAEEIAEVERRDKLPYGEAVLLRCARSIVTEYLRRGSGSLWRDAASVMAPSLVIYGSHDRLVDPRMAGRAARAFRGGRVVVLPRTGHVAQMERPAAVAAELRRMITSPACAYGGHGDGAADHQYARTRRSWHRDSERPSLTRVHAALARHRGPAAPAGEWE
jgi:pimeloyl-ACP methyl ester carboxylesterase